MSNYLVDRRKEDDAVEALVLLRFAATINPFEFAKIDRLDRPDHLRKAWTAAGIRPSAMHNTEEKLWLGMSDTDAIIKNAFDDNKRPIGRISALAIARHQVSIDTIAYAAQMSGTMLYESNNNQALYSEVVKGDRSVMDVDEYLNHPEEYRRFVIDDSQTAIIQHPDYDDSWENRTGSHGCPFAYGETARPKVFDKFARWAGTLSVLDYYLSRVN